MKKGASVMFVRWIAVVNMSVTKLKLSVAVGDQCDQIGLFLKSLGNKLFFKSSQVFGVFGAN